MIEGSCNLECDTLALSWQINCVYCVTVKPRNQGVQSDGERRELGILDQPSSRLGCIKLVVNIFAGQKLDTFMGKYRLLVRYIPPLDVGG